MKIKIDATIIADELAKADVVKLYLSLFRVIHNKKIYSYQIRNYIDGQTENTVPKSLQEGIDTMYQRQYDYYFEILTNHAL